MAKQGIHRRHFLIGAAGTAGATVMLAGGTAPAMAQDGTLPEFVDWKEADALIQHSDKTFETKRGAIGASSITPNDIVYVRNNLPSLTEEQVGDREAWTVAIEGVAQPGELTLAQLKNMGVETVASVLQCSGNGRGFFDHDPSGSQWTVGAAGNVIWTGVPVRAVVEALGGAAGGARFLTGTGGEPLPEGLDPLTIMIERSVPIEVMDRALLAWEMNGEPVPLAHGGPLRLVVPGFYGINNVKHLKKLALTEEESKAKVQQTSYRVRPVGVSGAPDQPSMYDMAVKSWVTHPLMEAETGRVLINGVAMGGTEALEKVEVSTDGGSTWQEAELVGPDLGVYAWRPFAISAELPAGTHRIASRATTVGGAVQPEEFEPNHRGYGHNGWQAHAVDVTVG
ncbi:MAG TPA: sulfite oxidase [Paracoccaceae bacterium]|nr:sulfite oxidase [Paracoccaceae bacterium]